MNKFLITQLFCLAIVISSVSINAEGNDMEQLSGQYLGLTPPGIEPGRNCVQIRPEYASKGRNSLYGRD